MSTRGYSRRELLHLGGKLVMTVGAAKIVVALPGCGGHGSSNDVPPPDAYDYYAGYVPLDDCHAIGTYDYVINRPGVPPYTYHYYFTGAYGCPNYVHPPTNVHCYYDLPDFAAGYAYFCFSSYYVTHTSP